MIPFKKIKSVSGITLASVLTVVLMTSCEPPAKKNRKSEVLLVNDGKEYSDSLSRFDTLVHQAMQEAKEVELHVKNIEEFAKKQKLKAQLVSSQKNKSGFRSGPMPVN